MSDASQDPERLIDYRRNARYERKVVIFYDVLGWRSQIARAGKDERLIGNLRHLIQTSTATDVLSLVLLGWYSTFAGPLRGA
jgi:hypothetical protein